ncbi:phosphate transporter PHO1 homolog 3-like isoform X2 [Tasmannia lanceolata]|uniref:phosphate transporter PHO1 homolog 3-like isoform X2 n=1 Tax=Tasmannia lanceolata TaxID=3420 RepID=UPI004062ED41
MKFGKGFTSQMVPEWQEAYMDYNQLKTILKDVLRFKQQSNPNPTRTLKRKMTLYRAFSGLTRRYNNLMSPTKSPDSEDDQVILIQKQEGSVEVEEYRTMFLLFSNEGGHIELFFFKRLDEEFNKANNFYKAKVKDIINEADALNKQMDALIALRIKVDPNFSPTLLNSDCNSSPAMIHATEMPMPSVRMADARLDAIQEIEMSSDDCSNEAHGVRVGNRLNFNSTTSRPAPLLVLNRVKLNVQLETPRSTLRGMLLESNSRDLSFNQLELKKVEKQLKRAFIEFYQKLHLLKSYSFLNLLGFAKILKKYNKITSRNASRSYLRMVDNSYLGSSDEVSKLLERVEATFIKHFSNSNRRQGIKFLRPTARRERHRITFFLGFTAGCSIALLVALVLVIRAHKILSQRGATTYMENMFPLYSIFLFIILHMLMYAGNIYFWRHYRVNYPFIFGFKQGTELGYREVCLLSSTLAVLALAAVLSNMDMEIDPKTKEYKTFTQLEPMFLVTMVLLITFCPFKIIYHSSRLFLLRCAYHCILAPLYKVQAIRCLEFYVCYYGWGDVKHRMQHCSKSSVFDSFYFIIAVVPYWSRLMQCIRRMFEEKDAMQGYNGLKYFSTIVAVVMRTAFGLNNGMFWKVMAAFTSAIATVYSTYWDIVMDWGLLQRHSKNRWLRDKLLVPHKSVYFAAMVLNVLLRFAWVQSVLNFEVSFLHRNAMSAIVACLEILRRGIWNFFRLENEHLNNVGKFRAFKSVPLPFNYDEDEDKDE